MEPRRKLSPNRRTKTIQVRVTDQEYKALYKIHKIVSVAVRVCIREKLKLKVKDNPYNMTGKYKKAL